MAIYIKREFKTKEERDKKMKQFHEALVGTPAYVSSEIAIIRNGDFDFTLCIGSDNEHNLTLFRRE